MKKEKGSSNKQPLRKRAEEFLRKVLKLLQRTWGQVSTFNKPGFPPNFSHSFLKFFILKDLMLESPAALADR